MLVVCIQTPLRSVVAHLRGCILTQAAVRWPVKQLCWHVMLTVMRLTHACLAVCSYSSGMLACELKAALAVLPLVCFSPYSVIDTNQEPCFHHKPVAFPCSQAAACIPAFLHWLITPLLLHTQPSIPVLSALLTGDCKNARWHLCSSRMPASV